MQRRLLLQRTVAIFFVVSLALVYGTNLALAESTNCGAIPFVPSVGIPGSPFIAGQPMTVSCTSIGAYIQSVYTFSIYVGGMVASVVLMIGGFLWLTAGGNPNQIGTARTYIGGALSGYVLLLLSWTLLQTINPALVQFRPLSVAPINNVPIPLVQSSCCVCAQRSSPPTYNCQAQVNRSDNVGGVCVCGGDISSGFSVAGSEQCVAPGQNCQFNDLGLNSSAVTSDICRTGLGLPSTYDCSFDSRDCNTIDQCTGSSAVNKGVGLACDKDEDCGQNLKCNWAFVSYIGSDSSTKSIFNPFSQLPGGLNPVGKHGTCSQLSANDGFCWKDNDCQSGHCSYLQWQTYGEALKALYRYGKCVAS